MEFLSLRSLMEKTMHKNVCDHTEGDRASQAVHLPRFSTTACCSLAR